MATSYLPLLMFRNSRAETQAPGTVNLPILETHTRRELYDLMLGLVEDRTTYDTLLDLAKEIENEDIHPLFSGPLVDRSAEIRSSAGYAGLFNPRAICYMNSLLTQRLFAEMQNSYRRSVDPRAFASCLHNIDKTPIDITVQMDADEFYNLLFDQWEAQLVQPDHKQRFRSFYGGQTLNQIKSKECDHVSERAEPFFAVQCDVKDKANLFESLQAYVQGDAMEGDNKYKCESCGGKLVDAVKRYVLTLYVASGG
jgi:ubiquitin carboxyl-terminal hydrolase 34